MKNSGGPKGSRNIERQLNIVSAQNLYRHIVDTPSIKNRSWVKAATEEEKRFFSKPKECQRGEVWTTNTQIADNSGSVFGTVPLAVPVLIWWGTGERADNMIRVIPLSLDVDFLFWPESVKIDSPNNENYPLLVEVFNESPMLSFNLRRLLGRIKSRELVKISKARNNFLGNKKSYSDPGEDYHRWLEIEIKLTEYLLLPVNLYI